METAGPVDTRIGRSRVESFSSAYIIRRMRRSAEALKNKDWKLMYGEERKGERTDRSSGGDRAELVESVESWAVGSCQD